MSEIIIPKPTPRGRHIAFLLLVVSVCVIVCVLIFRFRNEKREHTAADFGFEDRKSGRDADGDGIDDWEDMMLGARAYIATDPEYKSAYYAGGYPPAGEGVCTDVIWQAFAAAGYNLKELVDADIRAYPAAYPDHSDANIDFRRVRNLQVFFERNAQSLPVSLTDAEDWMPGDIVIFDGHIALCSDKRNAHGYPYIIHHGNNISRAREENDLPLMKIVGHYRWMDDPS